MTRHLQNIVQRYPARRDALVAILRDIHATLGHLPREAMEEVARHCHVAPVEVYGVATFHRRFRLRPEARNTLNVCQGTTCHLMGGGRLLEELRSRLGIDAGGTTPDGLFSLGVAPCLGACTQAPVLALNRETHFRVKPHQIMEILHEAGNRP